MVRKSDAEKGPLGAWATHARDLLGLSVAQAAAAAGVKEATYRKIEGGSNPAPGRRTVYELWRYFRDQGAAQGIPIEDPPDEWAQIGSASVTVAVGDPLALIRAIERLAEIQARQTDVLSALVTQIADMGTAQSTVAALVGGLAAAQLPRETLEALVPGLRDRPALLGPQHPRSARP